MLRSFPTVLPAVPFSGVSLAAARHSFCRPFHVSLDKMNPFVDSAKRPRPPDKGFRGIPQAKLSTKR
jgi:hypothetical protein